MMPEGRITTRRSQFFDVFESGWTASIYDVFESGTRLAEQLSAPRIRRELRAGRARYAGVDCIFLSLGPKDSCDICYFDPQRGYALIGLEEWGRGSLDSRLTVTELTEAAPGVFYPKTATMDQFPTWLSGPANFKRQGQFQASSVIANDPHFSPAVFEIPWPDRTAIWNLDTKEVTKAGG